MIFKKLKTLLTSGILAGVMILAGFFLAPQVQSQLPIPFNNITQPSPSNQQGTNAVISDCVQLQGRCLFRIAAQKGELAERVEQIEQRLQDLAQTYANDEDAQLTITQEQVGNLRDIYASIGYKEYRLMTVTSEDAKLQQVDIPTRTEQIIEQLEQGLEQAQQEQQDSFLIRQGMIALVSLAILSLANLALSRWRWRLKRAKAQVDPSRFSGPQTVQTELDQRQKWHFREVKLLLVQIAQIILWIGGILFILGLFPQTRAAQSTVITALKIPFRISVVAIITYIAIRLGYALIARFTNAITSHYSLVHQESNRRLQLRVNTISAIAKSIIAVTFVIIGILVALSSVGLDIAPILAGAGIIGLAVSLASQNLIKDTLNGFFIILEDQYAVGDVINVGDLGGLVENMNLRITQLRDSEGRLITIPNSEIRAVANLSSQWSRADLPIPVAYQTDVDKALSLIGQIAQQMNQEPQWKANILEPPEVLGVDNFDDRGLIIRVWIKTKPLKQWDVSREFRRRLKVAFDKAGIPIPPPQQQVWFERSFATNVQGNGHG
ncbi:MscS Mechanosensitive ion channel [Gloeothece citriformis PCC 7424]|uniref:MscS Mechanosensitive ion channel n=1 Tax=Gloeothece citriformis (strain PCC 7424) TaxID=65393 RepID=B7K896_GLOC7|nr:mechanosensitive ion channel family protein [Gloeothece citriformis]ACK69856.1 MscS Mechanosensitive ion channel [Gloeothece citriformis PCC 7424]